jgi:Rad3-related DNA helicase
MQQGWVQVAGLVADISGFGLIVSEWWNAVIRERAVDLVHRAHHFETIAEQLKSRPKSDRWTNRALDRIVISLLEGKEAALEKARALSDHDPVLLFRMRLRNFLLGAALVVLGFILQVLSAIPGGIPLIGLTP